MYFMGDSNAKGTYYFHSVQHKGWVVADLDLQKARLCHRLAIVTCNNMDGGLCEEHLEKMAYAKNGDRWLIDGASEELVALLREHAGAVEVIAVYKENGDVQVGGKLEEEASKIAGNIKKRHDK